MWDLVEIGTTIKRWVLPGFICVLGLVYCVAASTLDSWAIIRDPGKHVFHILILPIIVDLVASGYRRSSGLWTPQPLLRPALALVFSILAVSGTLSGAHNALMRPTAETLPYPLDFQSDDKTFAEKHSDGILSCARQIASTEEMKKAIPESPSLRPSDVQAQMAKLRESLRAKVRETPCSDETCGLQEQKLYARAVAIIGSPSKECNPNDPYNSPEASRSYCDIVGFWGWLGPGLSALGFGVAGFELALIFLLFPQCGSLVIREQSFLRTSIVSYSPTLWPHSCYLLCGCPSL